LALAQTRQIADSVTAASGFPVELIPMTTAGDRSTQSLATLGGTGVFASALREVLLAGDCDLVVHSLKDLPTVQPDGLVIGAIPKRADARDALCARDGLTLDALPAGARIGTGSPRRVAQLRQRRSDLDVVDLRGNVDTRLGRVRKGDLDAVVLAAAGLSRLGRLESVTEFFDLAEVPTAPGQGALAVEVRQETMSRLAAVLKGLDHPGSRMVAVAERAVLARLEAGCSAPVGASAILDGDLLLLSATVYRPDGTESLTSSFGLVIEGSAAERAMLGEELGSRVANDLLHRGAAELADLGGSR
jgi:hydroxymethylbilane synthase